nr:hypothetical protein [Tanacetum cinerariifolium]
MASEQSSSGPVLQEMIPGTISSGLVQKSSSSTSYVLPLRNDWDLLFQPLFDELLNPLPSVDYQDAEVIAPIAEVIPQVDDDSTGSPSSTIVDQDAPSPSKSPTPTKIQYSVILQDVGNDNLDIEVAHMRNDPLLGVPITEGSVGLVALAGCFPLAAAVSLGVAATVVIGLGDATAVGGVVDESEPPLFLLALTFGFRAASPVAQA